MNFELVFDRVLSVFVLDGAGVFAGVVAGDFANEQRSFGHEPHALRGNVRSAFDFPLDFRQRSANSLARQFDIFAVRYAECVVERSNLGRNCGFKMDLN